MEKREVAYLAVSMFSAAMAASLMVFFAFSSGLREIYTEVDIFVLNPGFELLVFQWILGYIFYGIVMFFVLRLGRVKRDMHLHFVVVLLSLQFTIPIVWPFIFVALGSSVLSVFSLVALFVLQAWTVVLLRRFSELGAYIHAVNASISVLYVYYTVGAVVQNSGMIGYF